MRRRKGFILFRKMKPYNYNGVCKKIHKAPAGVIRLFNLYAHAVAVMRLDLSKKNNPLRK